MRTLALWTWAEGPLIRQISGMQRLDEVVRDRDRKARCERKRDRGFSRVLAAHDFNRIARNVPGNERIDPNNNSSKKRHLLSSKQMIANAGTIF